MKKAWLVLLVLVTITLFGYSRVIAAKAPDNDGMSYSALGCTEVPLKLAVSPIPDLGGVVPTNPNLYGENDVRFNTRGWAFSANEESAIRVSCPIVRDQTGNPMFTATVTVWNNSLIEDVTCEIQSYFSNGTLAERSDTFFFPPNPSIEPAPVTLFKSNDPNDCGRDCNEGVLPSLANPDGYYILTCILPLTVTSNFCEGKVSAHGNCPIRAGYIVGYTIGEVASTR